jgi:hypothetical protein
VRPAQKIGFQLTFVGAVRAQALGQEFRDALSSSAINLSALRDNGN